MRVLLPSQARAGAELDWLIWVAFIIPLGLVILAGRWIIRHVDVHMRAEKAACKKGDASACATVGEGYIERSTASRYHDDEVAEDYLRRACNLGRMASCDRLGWVATHTDDATFDNGLALSSWKKACRGGVTQACFDAGDLLETQLHDAGAALSEFERGCEAGDARACFRQGYLLYFGANASNAPGGVEVTLDKPRGIALIRKACDAGDEDACEVLK